MTTARAFLGLTVIEDTTREQALGEIESVLIHPRLLTVDGFLVRITDQNAVAYLPRQCLQAVEDKRVRVCDHLGEAGPDLRRVFGLSAWTMHPKFLVGFVYDFSFDLATGLIDSFTIHQIIRTWTIPATAAKITPKALLIDNDTTLKLKLTPFPSEGI